MDVQKRFVVKVGVLLILVSVLLVFTEACRGQETDWSQLEKLQIGRIELVGNVSIQRKDIISVIRSREGNFFRKDVADKDIELIGDKIEGVREVLWDAKQVDNEVNRIISILEQNIVRKLIFIGNRGISSAKLAKEAGIIKGNYLDTHLARSGMGVLEDLYREKGYADVKVTLAEDKLSLGQVEYTIEEGPRIKIQEVSFEGNEAIKTKELKKVVKTKPRKFFFWPVYYNRKVVEQDIDKLKEVFQEKGFFDPDVTAFESREGEKSVRITFAINEGPVYNVDKIVITGNEFFSGQELTKDLKLKVGEYYSKPKSDHDAESILKRYRENGFVKATVEHSFALVSRVAKFEVTDGPHYKIGEVIITGNEMTQDKVIRRILDEENFKPGQWFNADIARGDGQGELEKIVRRRVLTESISIRPVGEGETHRDAHVNITEGKTGNISFGVGVASDSGMIGQVIYDQRDFDITDRPESWSELFTGKSFKGAGQHMRISLMPGLVESNYSVSFTEPFLYDKPVSLDLVGSSFEREWESYEEERLKAYLGFEKRYPDRWRRGISFRAVNVDVSGIEADAPREIKDVKGSTDLLGVRLFVRKDTTDSRFMPSKGYIFNASYEQVGGDYTFGILKGTQRWYRVLREDLAERKTILETKLYAATVVGDAPPFEKFYAGGSRTIRGFDYRGVSTRGLSTGPGPKVREDPIGSDWIIVGNTEMVVPLTTEVLSLLFFVDAGAIDTGGVRASVGIGLQIMIPQWFGPVPMRFELATPLMKDDDDETRVFSFTVGALF